MFDYLATPGSISSGGRRVRSSRSDHKMLQFCSPVAGIDSTGKYATPVESDGESVKVQIAGQCDTVEVPVSQLKVPPMLITGLDWSALEFSSCPCFSIRQAE